GEQRRNRPGRRPRHLGHHRGEVGPRGAVNLRSVFVCSKAAIPVMLEAGGGSIVNVASIAASVCTGGAAYAASKGAILSYTRHTARELARRGVRMNAVSPGFMRTPMTTG